MTGTGIEGHQESPARGERWLAALAGALALLFAAALFYPLLRGNVYLGSDLGAYHLPVRTFYSHCLKEGLRFLWWPDAFCGYYLHGEGQAGMFHPLHWVLYRFLPLDWAFNLEFASGYAIAYAGTVALLRRWALPWYAALFGANLFAFSGFTLIHFMHMQAVAIIGHLPWMLLAVEVILKAETRRGLRRAWVALALLAASQLLLGYPQYVLFTLLALGLYSIAPMRVPGVWRRVPLLAAALIVGLLIAGVQVAPTFDVLQTALRQDNAEAWRSGSMHPLNLLQWAGPYWFKNHLGYGVPAHEYGLYTGTVPLLLSAWLLWQRRALGTRRGLVAFFGILVLLASVMALGEYGGLYALVAKLPVIGSFRCSARHIVLIHFSLAVLSALAANELQSHRANTRRDRKFLSIALAVAWATLLPVIALRLLGPDAMRDALAGEVHWLIAGPLLMTLVAAVIYCSARRPQWGLAALMLVAALDLGLHALPKVWNHAPQSSSLTALEAVLRQELPAGLDESQSRDFRAHGNWRMARLTQVGLPNYMGYVGLPPAWKLDPNADITKRLAGVRWEKRPLHAAAWTVHEDALPRVRLVTQAIATDASEKAPASVDVAKVAVTERPVALGVGLPGTVTWTLDEPGDVAFETRTASTQLLVFAERYHPGWRVTVDGGAVPLERVYGDFMGCVVPAGTHPVTFYFAPTSMRVGIALSAVGLLALFVGWHSIGRIGPIRQISRIGPIGRR